MLEIQEKSSDDVRPWELNEEKKILGLTFSEIKFILFGIFIIGIAFYLLR